MMSPHDQKTESDQDHLRHRHGAMPVPTSEAINEGIEGIKDYSSTGVPTWYEEIQIQLKTFTPTLVGMMLTRVPWLISLRYLGRLCTTEQLAAASFANSLANITGLAFAWALTSAISTLTSQSKGELTKRILENGGDDEENGGIIEMRPKLLERVQLLKAKDSSSDSLTLATELSSSADSLSPSTIVRDNIETDIVVSEDDLPLITPLVILYRGLFVITMFILPVTCWWIFGMRSTLKAMKQDDGLIDLTIPYLKILIPGLFGISYHWTISAWLQSIGLAHILPWVGGIGLALHIPANYILMVTCGFGYYGNAWATVINQISQPLVLILYLTCTEHGRVQVLDAIGATALGRSGSSWREVHVALSTGIFQYLQLAFPSIIAVSEWWAGEVCTVLAGNLPFPDISLGSMAMFQILNDMAFMFPTAWNAAGTMRIGNWLGGNEPEKAQHSSRVLLTCSVLSSVTLAMLLLSFPYDFFPSLFAPEAEELIKMTSKTIPFLAVYMIGDSVACSCNGIMKGCGRQLAELPAVVTAYWFIGVPVAYHQAFTKQQGVVGLVTGTTLGTCAHGFFLLLVVGLCTNWRHEADLAQKRVRESY